MLDPFQKRAVAQALAEQMQRTQERVRLTRRRLDDLLAAIPTGIPQPDSSLLIKQAADEYKDALRASNDALERWKNFVAYDVVPDDL